MVVMLAGCTQLQHSNGSVVQVQTSQNPARAIRLTEAGIKSLGRGATEDASRKFTAAIASDETYGPAHNNLGLMHYEQGDLYQAVLSFERAMEFSPHDPTVYYNLGLALESAGKTYEALDLYQQAVELDGTNPNFLGNLVRLRIRMGESDESVRSQLKDLVLIEDRPEWRAWADKQLSLDLNPQLDRGPDAPDFNRELEQSGTGRSNGKRVIDLSLDDNQPEFENQNTVTELTPPQISRSNLLPEPVKTLNEIQIQDASDLSTEDYFRE